MSADSPIEWTDHTFNPWWGCAKVSPGCDHCYAERLARRFGTKWGVAEERREFGESHWLEPSDWNRRAEKRGVRERVFCASMADVFDVDAPEGIREQLLWPLIESTPQLDWLLLTKRIGNARRMLPAGWLERPRANVWLGATVVDQEEADRDIPKLLATPARVRFLSIEPMLGPIDLRRIVLHSGPFEPSDVAPAKWRNIETVNIVIDSTKPGAKSGRGAIDWVIAGGESGPRARPANLDWFRSLRDQCAAARVPFLLKQHGEWLGCETEASTERRGRAVYPDDGYGVELEDRRRYRTVHLHGREFVAVGKKAAGRILDGVQHDGFPAAVVKP